MFRNLFSWHRSPASSSRPSFRPKVEVLEDRTVPASVTATAAAQNGLSTLFANPTLSNANSLLNNQLAGAVASLPLLSGGGSGSQLVSSTLGNSIQLSSNSGVPNAIADAIILLEQEAQLSTDIALIILDPAMGANTNFAANVDSLAASIHNNPLFSTSTGFTAALTAGALVLNQETSPFLGGGNANTGAVFGANSSLSGLTAALLGLGGASSIAGVGPNTFSLNSAFSGLGSTMSLSGLSNNTFGFNTGAFGAGTSLLGSAQNQIGLSTSPSAFATPFGFTTSPFGFTQTQTNVNTVPSNFSQAVYGFDSFPSGTSPVTFGFSASEVGFSTSQFGFGSTMTV